MRRILSIKVALWIAASAVSGSFGCGTPAKDDPGLSVDAFCQGKAQQECQVASRCGTQTGACVASRTSRCSATVAQQTTGTRAYRAANAQGCIDKTKAVYAQNTITAKDLDAIDDVCGRVFQGTAKALAPCAIDFDCEGSLICDKKLCANRAIKKLGELCGTPGEICDAGAFCGNAAGGARQCLAKKAAGDACDATTAPCLESLRCSTTCLDRFQSGGACTSNDECAASAPYCDPYIGKKCDAGLGFAPGAPVCKDFGG
ncbi:MAG: hypothetical protein NVS3B20_04810 [Polyangiales bacterium]